MRASLIALLVLFVAVAVAGVAVDAYYITYYYGSSTCNTSESRVVFGLTTFCFSYNTTYTLNYQTAELTKCNSSTGRYSYTSWFGTFCNAGSRDTFFDAAVGECQALSTVSGRNGSMRVYCNDYTTTSLAATSTTVPATVAASASSVSSSTAACAAVTCLLFIFSVLTF
jgi:hypothetical protein